MASTPTAWRVVERLAQDPDGLAGCAWPARTLVGGHGRPAAIRKWRLLVIDADATLVLAHSDRKEGAAGTYKHSFGFAPLLAYLDRAKPQASPWPACYGPATPPPAPPMT